MRKLRDKIDTLCKSCRELKEHKFTSTTRNLGTDNENRIIFGRRTIRLVCSNCGKRTEYEEEI